jgi:hypothetical protein
MPHPRHCERSKAIHLTTSAKPKPSPPSLRAQRSNPSHDFSQCQAPIPVIASAAKQSTPRLQPSPSPHPRHCERSEAIHPTTSTKPKPPPPSLRAQRSNPPHDFNQAQAPTTVIASAAKQSISRLQPSPSPYHRHCERSEAIHPTTSTKPKPLPPSLRAQRSNPPHDFNQAQAPTTVIASAAKQSIP